MMDKEIQKAFRLSNSSDRYLRLSEKYQVAVKEQFENIENERVLEILNTLGFKATYNKKENFFKLASKEQNFKFQLNISLKYGEVDLIWCVWRGKELLEGSPLGVLVKWDISTDKQIFRPTFRSYEELEKLLNEAIHMFNDFKVAVLNVYK
ncbi:hypothetical protein V3851_18215 [Paenibacillus sp. M1]|uniref:Uncharacterized protein n=1 Tax=Paenibacillus haidiansis TaxID=1574488 RepID=A0ABU7VWA8_9BACL